MECANPEILRVNLLCLADVCRLVVLLAQQIEVAVAVVHDEWDDKTTSLRRACLQCLRAVGWVSRRETALAGGEHRG